MAPPDSVRLKWMLAPLLALAMLFSLGGASAQSRNLYSQQSLDAMLAPVALYPDALLSQVLMAATYPVEVVEAARWSNARPGLSGDAAVRAAYRENWDPSVKSLLAFPQILGRMNEDLQWTQALGDAFLEQEGRVMDTVQELRYQAQVAGNLRSDDRIRVIDNGMSLTLQFFNPQVAYLPYYDPMVAYGSWRWPTHPPVYWRPWAGYTSRPGYASGFYWSSPVGIPAGFFFGEFDWRQREVRVVEVSNAYYNTVTVNRKVVVDRGPRAWRHETEHRKGVAYRSADVQQRVIERVQPEHIVRAVETRRPESRAARSGESYPDSRGNRQEVRSEPAHRLESPREPHGQVRVAQVTPRETAAPTIAAHAYAPRGADPRTTAPVAQAAVLPAAAAAKVSHRETRTDAGTRREAGDDLPARRDGGTRNRTTSLQPAS